MQDSAWCGNIICEKENLTVAFDIEYPNCSLSSLRHRFFWNANVRVGAVGEAINMKSQVPEKFVTVVTALV